MHVETEQVSIQSYVYAPPRGAGPICAIHGHTAEAGASMSRPASRRRRSSSSSPRVAHGPRNRCPPVRTASAGSGSRRRRPPGRPRGSAAPLHRPVPSDKARPRRASTRGRADADGRRRSRPDVGHRVCHSPGCLLERLMRRRSHRRPHGGSAGVWVVERANGRGRDEIEVGHDTDSDPAASGSRLRPRNALARPT